MNATEEQIPAATDVNLVFLRPCDPAMVDVGFLFHPLDCSMVPARTGIGFVGFTRLAPAGPPGMLQAVITAFRNAAGLSCIARERK